MIDPGRNNPCPCGSGKKYKKCCLPKKEAAVFGDLNWIRMRRTEGELIHVLLNHMKKHYGPLAIPEAWDDFTVGSGLSMDPEETPEVDSAFPPWLLFNWIPYPFAENREKELPEIPVALHYLQHRPERVDSYQQRLITEACSQPYSFFQVTDTVPGKHLMLRDIILQQEVTVHERQSSSTLGKGNILFSRVITMDGDSVMLGAAPVMIPGRFFDQILGFREQVAKNRTIHRDTLHDYGIELRQLYFDLREECLYPSAPQVQNTDGDPLQMTKIHYGLKCPVNNALDALLPLTLENDSDEFRDEGEYDAQGDLVAIDIPWLKKGNKSNPGWDNTVMGHLEINHRRLAVSVNSQKRAEMIEARIARLLGDRAELKNREIETLGSLQEKANKRSVGNRPSEEDRRQEELMANPEIQARIKEMAHEHWRTWPDIPIPALDGVTPREAAKTPLGREKLEALLLEFEGRKDGPKAFKTDLEALRKDLGI